MLNVFIAVIIDTFSEEKEGADSYLNDQQVATFKETWAKFDESATGFIPLRMLSAFLEALPAPLGFKFAPGAPAPAAREIQDSIAKLRPLPLLRDERTSTQLIFYGDLIFAIARKEALHFAEEQGEQEAANHLFKAADDFVERQLQQRKRRQTRRHRMVESDLTADHRFAGANLHFAFRNRTFCRAIQMRLQERNSMTS